MKIYIVTESYVDGSKYVCSVTHRGTKELVQVHHRLEEAEMALKEFEDGIGPDDGFTYEINELEL